MLELLYTMIFLVQPHWCVPGGIVNGLYQNYTVNSTSLNTLTQSIFCNFPWFPALFVVMIYICLFVIWIKVPGRMKYIVITFIPMLLSWIMISYSWASPPLGDATTGLFLFVTFFVFLTRE